MSNPTTTNEKAQAEHDAEMRAATPLPHPDSPLPWHVSTNGAPPESGGEPAFPGVHDASGRPHGEDIVANCLGFSEECKENAAYIVYACNRLPQLTRELAAVRAERDQHQITIVALRNQGDVSERGWKRVERERDAANAELATLRARLTSAEAANAELRVALEQVLKQRNNIEVMGEWSALDMNRRLYADEKRRIDVIYDKAHVALAAAPYLKP